MVKKILKIIIWAISLNIIPVLSAYLHWANETNTVLVDYLLGWGIQMVIIMFVGIIIMVDNS